MLKDMPIAVTPNNGSEFTTLKMMEGFLAPEHVKRANVGSMLKRIEAVRDGQVAAASLSEPWISVAQKWGMHILIESHSTRSEAAGDDLDGPTLARVPRAGARRGAARAGPHALRSLPAARDGWSARAGRAPDLAPAPAARSRTPASASRTPTTGR